jgi:hypothetical protein
MSFQPEKTKILYLKDSYAQSVAGVKISLLNEMRKRGYTLDPQDVHSAGPNKINGKKLLRDLKRGGYTHLWVAHTWVQYAGCTLADINKLGVKVLGFGFSDPYGWDKKRLSQYNYYATHSIKLSRIIKKIPTVQFTTSCDLSFHKDLNLSRTTDVLFIGSGVHPRFKNRNYRVEVIKQIRKRFPNTKVFGKNWPGVSSGLPISGNKFLEEINKAKVGIDIEEPDSPIAHRNFEFPACGTPIITRSRPETGLIFKNKIMPVYRDLDGLISWIARMLFELNIKDGYYQKFKTGMYDYVRKNHTIKNRVDVLLNWLDRVNK